MNILITGGAGYVGSHITEELVKVSKGKKNDIIILNSGGHGFKVLETVEMIEVKQGPYNIKTDKKVFNSINDKFVKIK